MLLLLTTVVYKIMSEIMRSKVSENILTVRGQSMFVSFLVMMITFSGQMAHTIFVKKF